MGSYVEDQLEVMPTATIKQQHITVIPEQLPCSQSPQEICYYFMQIHLNYSKSALPITSVHEALISTCKCWGM